MIQRLAINAYAVLFLAAALVACSGVKLAYDTATTLDAKAYVVTEHYAAVLREANDLADQSGNAELIDRMQAADLAARPLVLNLRTAAQAYAAASSATNAEELQAALNDAAIAVAEFARIVRQ